MPDSNPIDELRRAVESLQQQLRQEKARSEVLRQRLTQQEAQIRDLQKTTRSILESRIWRALVQTGGTLLSLKSQARNIGTRFQVGRAKVLGGPAEPMHIVIDRPSKRLDPLPGRIRVEGWAAAASGIRAVSVRVADLPSETADIALPRPDIGRIHPECHDSARAGFRAIVDLSSLPGGNYNLKVEAISIGGALAVSELPIHVRAVTHGQRTSAAVARVLAELPHKPLISILTPVYNTPEKWLRRCIDSVIAQQYPNWELCIADDCSTAPHVRAVLQQYAAKEPRIKISWRETNGHIARATNTALESAEGEYIALLDHDDELTHDALLEVAIATNENPWADMIYSDEDKIDEYGVCTDPFYKPDWSPDYFLTCMYTCHLGVYRTALVREIGGFRSEMNGAQDYDLVLHIVARTDRIHHIPKVLYHWRMHEESTASGAAAKDYAYPAAQRALANYLALAGTPGEVLPGPREGFHRIAFQIHGRPRVSIVMPTAGQIIEHHGRRLDLVKMCVASILEKSTWPEIEIVVMHNCDLPPATEDWLQSRTVLVPYRSEPFNLAEKINLGARHATGEHIVLLNDDTEVISPDWIESMLQYSQQPRVGAVGAKLLFPNNRIQHAGVVLLNCNPGHAYYDHPADDPGYFVSTQVARNYIAVTGACMMTRHELWDKVGGFSEDFPLNYNDVDYCLKVRDEGCRTVYVPEAELYHYESVSREAAGGVKPGELEHFKSKWLERYFLDPYYNINLPSDVPYYYPPD